MNVMQLLRVLSDTASTTEKVSLLEKYKDLDDLKLVLELTYNPKIKFWIKSRPQYTRMGLRTFNLTYALEQIRDVIATRIKTGNSAIQYLQFILNNISTDDQEVVCRVIERDLKCGINVKLINKVFPNLIPEYPVLLCLKLNDKTEKKINWSNAVIQKKEDGCRVNLEFEHNRCISATTRNGNLLDIPTFNNIMSLDIRHFILDGELLYAPNGIIAERKVISGITNKAIKGTITQDEAQDLIFICWDYIPYDDFIKGNSDTAYHARYRAMINSIVPDSKIKPILSQPAIDKDHAMAVYQEYLDNGFEGIILKNLDATWSGTRSSEYLKVKRGGVNGEKSECELLVTGFNYGKKGTKYEQVLGALLCESACGKLKVSVGTGFDDNSRNNPEQYLDKIVTIIYNAVIDSKSKDTKSLFLPVYSEIRNDKDIANILEEII